MVYVDAEDEPVRSAPGEAGRPAQLPCKQRPQTSADARLLAAAQHTHLRAAHTRRPPPAADPHPRAPTACAPGCAPLPRVPRTRWSRTLFWQMAVYVSWILVSMALGALAPTIIAWREYKPPPAPAASPYAYCPKGRSYNFSECLGTGLGPFE